MTITMYDLAGADLSRRFSPFCWRTRMALAHKRLDVETIPWRFTDKQTIAFSGQGRVPVIRDGERTVFDSWTIATDLEARYPDRPSLFGGRAGLALACFVNNWADTVLHPGIARGGAGQPRRRCSGLPPGPAAGGEAANYADNIVFGAFQWARVASPFQLLTIDDPIFHWCDRLLDAFGGLARNVPTVEK